MSRLTSEEKALEQFPDEIFTQDFQGEIKRIYKSFVTTIAMIKKPVFRKEDRNWYPIYRVAFFLEDNFSLEFVDPNIYFDGVVKVVPVDNSPATINKSEKQEYAREGNVVFLPSANLQVVSIKQLERKIRFFNVYRSDLIFKYLGSDPIILNEAQKRFPNNSLMIVESMTIKDEKGGSRNDKIPGTLSSLLKPSSEQFTKLIKFSHKLQEALKGI